MKRMSVICKCSAAYLKNTQASVCDAIGSEIHSPYSTYRGSCMSAHVLLNLLNELGKEIKCEACRAFYLFFATSLINSIIQEHEC